MIFKTYNENGKKNNNLIMDMVFLIVAVGLISIVLSMLFGIITNMFITNFKFSLLNLYYASGTIAFITYSVSFISYFKLSKASKTNPNS